MKTKKIAILYGGISSEREISLLSGKNIAKILRDLKKYSVFCYDLKKGLLRLIKDVVKKKIDCVFPVLHGRYGEDGTVQGFLEVFRVPYVGSGVLSSALCMDKEMTKKILKGEKILLPKSLVLNQKDWSKNTYRIIDQIVKTFSKGLVVKPATAGSSIGVTVLEKNPRKKKIKKAIDLALKYSDRLIIEEYIQGREITCAILEIEKDKPVPLPLIEIIPQRKFFDYIAKYNGKTKEVCPARINRLISKKAQNLALKAYRALQCRGFARVDMVLQGSKIYFFEVNTIPGLASVSLFPKAIKAIGMDFSKVLEKLISQSIFPN